MPKTKKFTEKEAWLYIANKFDKKPSEGFQYGLCAAIETLLEERRITAKTHWAMGSKIRAFKDRYEDKEIFSLYIWNLKFRSLRAGLARDFAAGITITED